MRPDARLKIFRTMLARRGCEWFSIPRSLSAKGMRRRVVGDGMARRTLREGEGLTR